MRRVRLGALVLLCARSVLAENSHSVPSDCKPRELRRGLMVTACLRDGPSEEEKTLLVTLGHGDTVELSVESPINASGTFEGNVLIEGLNERFFAFAYDDSECTVVKVVDRKTRRVVVDSGCKNSKYCRVARFPSKSECEVRLKCDQGKPMVYPVCSSE